MNAPEYFARWIKALNALDFGALEQMVDPDFVLDFPQSGERINGFGRWRLHLEQYPGGFTTDSTDPETSTIVGGEERWAIGPNFTVVPLAHGNQYTTLSNVTYPDGSRWLVVTLVELRDARAYRLQTFFVPGMPAPLAESIASFGRG